MKLTDSPEEAEWRNEVREFLNTELPKNLRRSRGNVMFAEAAGPGEGGSENGAPVSTEMRVGGQGFRMQGGAMGEWRLKLASRGWIAPAWPKEYGGAGLST